MKNRILSDKDRLMFAPLMEEMRKTIPELMVKKIPRSEVQATFVLDYILKFGKNKKILCIGCDEDLVYEYLNKIGVKVTAIDPLINYDLHTFYLKTQDKFDIIFSVSVMEHVKDDEQFIKEICDLLNINGIALLTMDFFEGYGEPRLTLDEVKRNIRLGRSVGTRFETSKERFKNLSTNVRLYTSADYKRLSKIVEDSDCFFVDEFIADVEPDFEIVGCKYNFSTMVFKKLH